MKAVRTFSLVLALAIFAVACSDSDDVTGVHQPTPAAIELSPTSLTLWALGQETTLDAQVFDAAGYLIEDGAGLGWSVNGDGATVTVAHDGTITALEDGEAEVIATVGEATASATVQVNATFIVVACLSELADDPTASEDCQTISITATN